MDTNEKYKSYYYNYLGINPSKRKSSEFIFQCSQREKPINRKYIQFLITTKISGRKVFSISPRLFESFSKYMSINTINEEGIITILDKYFENKFDDYNIRKMFRLTIEDVDFEVPKGINAVKLSKEILMKSMEDLTSQERRDIWNRKKDEVEQGRQYVIIINHKIVSYCKVSDIDYGGGNLVVWTSPEYRGRGYGKAVVSAATKWCLENNVLPVYWVDETNKASLNLAKNIGFRIQSEEIVVSNKL